MHNVGKIDRIVRISLASILAILYVTHLLDGKAGTAAIIVAGILAVTSTRRCCPLYAIFGLGTCGTGIDDSEPRIKTKKIDL